MSDKEREIEQRMITMFLGYKYRKQHDLLYSEESDVPRILITDYYSDKITRIDPSIINQGFVERYIRNESAMENVHDPSEIKGLEVMYEDMTNMKFNEFEMFSIMQLHRDLYSKCPHPECAGIIRNQDVFLPGSGVDLCNYSCCFDRLLELEDVVNELKKFAVYLKETNDYIDKPYDYKNSNIFLYIERCVKLKCDLIKVHPFNDGNGRTIRCFINKLFEEAGIPPVYIKVEEKVEYTRAMQEALTEGQFKDIINFYLYKICDSIIELDINKRVRQEKLEGKYETKKKNKKKKNGYHAIKTG